MKKLAAATFIFFLILLPFFYFLNEKKTMNRLIEKETFDPTLCQHGYAGSWSGACICFEGFQGRYCDLKKGDYSNKELQADSDFFNTKRIYQPVQKGGITFILSTELMSHTDALLFCPKIKKTYRLASREDFKCDKTGLNCLDKNLFHAIKKQYGHRGFFWLEEIKNSTKAYYTDLNDGTVYTTEKNNQSTAQALCVQRK